jgi:putative acetyltransferase
MNCTGQMICVKKAMSKSTIDAARTLLLEYGRLRNFDNALGDYQKELLELPGEYSPPQGCFLIALYNDTPAGCVALRRITNDICEMKRLYVTPEYRGKKVGYTLVVEIIKEALFLGYALMRLDTHPWMKDAESLYRRLGFQEIQAYHFNPIEGVKFFELDLQTTQ